MKQKAIINLYVPINTILMCDNNWKSSLNLPQLTLNDLKIINELRKSSAIPYIGGDLQKQKDIVLDSNLCIRKIKSLSFYEFLLNRFLKQAKEAAEAGIRNFLIQNSNAPYFNKKQPVIYWIMRCLVSQLKLICTNEFTIGLKLNGNIDDWALDIASRSKINYIICNDNIADLYLQRQFLNSNVKIYSNFDKDILSINQQGFIFETESEIDNVIGSRNYLKQLPFYPNVDVPVIFSLWQLKKISIKLQKVDFIIFNSCFCNNGFCDCGLNKNELIKFIEQN